MPELPEVETTRRGIEPHLKGTTIDQVVVRQAKLRWPIPRGLDQKLAGESVVTVGRRGKYLLLQTAPGTLILHLGMSGSLRITASDTPAGKHDHFDIRFGDQLLRLNDPRRFGAVLWCRGDPAKHKLLATLGPEPLDERFDGDHLHTLSRGRRVAVKQFIMDSKVVVGVGNIYASESLFRARIHPRTAASKISRTRYLALAKTIKEVLSEAITQGGTTLRDFTGSDGKPGYFTQQLNVYGRTGEPCPLCATPIKQLTLGQRSTFYCPSCQH